MEERSTDTPGTQGLHGLVLRLPGFVQLCAVNNDDAPIRVGDESKLVVGVAGVKCDVIEKDGRLGNDALWKPAAIYF